MVAVPATTERIHPRIVNLEVVGYALILHHNERICRRKAEAVLIFRSTQPTNGE